MLCGFADRLCGILVSHHFGLIWWFEMIDDWQLIRQAPAASPAVFCFPHTTLPLYWLLSLCTFIISAICLFLFFYFFVFNSWGPDSPASFSWSPRACFLSVPWLFSCVPPLAGIHAWAHREEQERTNKQRNKQWQENRCQTARRWRERERARKGEKWCSIILKHPQQKPTHKYCMSADWGSGALFLDHVGNEAS